MVDRPVQPVPFSNLGSARTGSTPDPEAYSKPEDTPKEKLRPERFGDGNFKRWEPDSRVVITRLAVLDTFMSLSREERQQIFGSHHALVQLDEESIEAVHLRIQARFEAELKARGLPADTTRAELRAIIDEEHAEFNLMCMASIKRHIEHRTNRTGSRRRLTSLSSFWRSMRRQSSS